MHLPIVLIGPIAAGKSTLGHAIAERLGVRQVPLDAVRFYYFLQSGFSFAEQARQPDYVALARYWKPFEIDAVERILQDFPNAVIDFGAGQAHFEDPARLARLQAALAPLPNVFLLLPHADPDRCAALCLERDQKRLKDRWDPAREQLIEQFVRSASFRSVAKHTVVTGDRPVDASLEEVLALLA